MPAQAIEAEFASEAKQITAESAFFAGGVLPRPPEARRVLPAKA
jgi:hypothetical protein